MTQHQFSGLIKCLNCGKNYKKKMERKKPVYICSGHSNYGKEFCSRFILEEEELVYTITKHFALRGISINGGISEFVERIEVKGRGFTVIYKDGSRSIINSTEDEYGIKVQY